MMNEVFISYSHKDCDIVDHLVKELEAAGITYFVDWKAIHGGDNYLDDITSQIRNSQVFLFVGSKNAYSSSWTMKEMAFAIKSKVGASILPVLADDAPLPDNLDFLLSDINFLKLHGQSLDAVINALLLMLGRKSEGILDFSKFIARWKSSSMTSPDETILSKYEELFGDNAIKDIRTTSYYKEELSHISIPYKIVFTEESWAKNYDWDLLVRMIVSYMTDLNDLGMYSFGFDCSWKLNTQSDPDLFLIWETITDGVYLERKELNRHRLFEEDVVELQTRLLKRFTETLVNWCQTDANGHDNFVTKILDDEIASIERSIYDERIKLFEKVEEFHEDRARVYVNWKYGFIDRKGKLVTPIEWPLALDFNEGLAAVLSPQEDGKWGYINRNGEVVINYRWAFASPFKNGLARVRHCSGDWFEINKLGHVIRKSDSIGIYLK